MHLSLALRGRHLLITDTLCVSAAFVLSFALRLDAPSVAFQSHIIRFAWLVLPLLVVRIGVNLYFRLYQRLWRYASVEEMQAIVLAALTGSIIFGLWCWLQLRRTELAGLRLPSLHRGHRVAALHRLSRRSSFLPSNGSSRKVGWRRKGRSCAGTSNEEGLSSGSRRCRRSRGERATAAIEACDAAGRFRRRRSR